MRWNNGLLLVTGINEELTHQEQIIFNLINDNNGILKAEMALRIGKSEKTVQRIIASLIEKDDNLRGMDVEVFTQGSFANNTNVRTEYYYKKSQRSH